MELEPEYLLKMQRIAKAHAIKRGHASIADDFASQVVIDLIQGRPADVFILLTDFLRREYGDTRSLSGRQKSDSRRFGLSLDEPVGGDDSLVLGERIGSPEPDPEPFQFSWRDRVVVFGRAAAIAQMYFDLGFNQREIGEIFGVTESRISKLLRPVKKMIEKAAIIEEVGDIYHDDKEYSKLEINWIRL